MPRTLKFLLAPLALAAGLCWTVPAFACPNCKEAVESSGETDADDPLRESRAYNTSIYFMLSVPYGILGIAGLYGYRVYRANHRRPVI